MIIVVIAGLVVVVDRYLWPRAVLSVFRSNQRLF